MNLQINYQLLKPRCLATEFLQVLRYQAAGLTFFMSYSEKLRDPRWQKCRLKIMERDSFVCQKCFDKSSTLNVHHQVYESKNPWETDEKYLITLCEDCHQSEQEDKKEREAEFIKAMYSVGFITSDLDTITRGLHKAERLHLPSHVVSDFLGFVFYTGIVRKFVTYYLHKITKLPLNADWPKVIYDYYTLRDWCANGVQISDWKSMLSFWMPKSIREKMETN